MHTHGRWVSPDPHDRVPVERMMPSQRDNLCTTCGVRVWSAEMALHDRWHDRLDAALNLREGGQA